MSKGFIQNIEGNHEVAKLDSPFYQGILDLPSIIAVANLFINCTMVIVKRGTIKFTLCFYNILPIVSEFFSLRTFGFKEYVCDSMNSCKRNF